MHLAAAAAAPTLGLFGPTPAAEYAPAGARTGVALSGTARMEDLSVADALAAAHALLARIAPPVATPLDAPYAA
jgi:ADP-heptose:LPS heptosyltransferase